jgi:diphthamide biosynthesis protein 4
MQVDLQLAYMPTHYEVLGLTKEQNGRQIMAAQTLKAAYRTSLLKHHPDKTRTSDQDLGTAAPPNPTAKVSIYSIDQITQAYAVLSVPALRSEYDRELKLKGGPTNAAQAGKTETFRTGVEIVDLDDLDYHEKEELWYRGCRCGDDHGFVLKEADLEEAADDGELNVGCKGCSLWMKVLFGVAEEGSRGEKDDGTPV